MNVFRLLQGKLAKLLGLTATPKRTMNILRLLQGKLADALTGLAADPAPYAAMVKPTQDPRHGDYQANCAMALAKALGRKPADVAQEIVRKLDLGDLLEPPQVAGPGFINLRLREDWLARRMQAMAHGDRLGVAAAAAPKTYVIDFSSPNVAKPMHVGHLRSTILGDALTRLLRFLGHAVITDNHLGDWGTQFGMLLYGYKHFVDKEAFAADPVHELARLYLHVRGLFKKDDDEDEDAADPVAEACRQETAKLHAGDPENVRLWQTFMPHCYEEIDHIYRRLGVRFDHRHGESFYNPMLPAVVRGVEEKGVAVPSQGALAIFFKEGEPPALVRKRDGAFTYTTSDLATIQYRVEHFKPNEMLYVVDARQALHFAHLFEAARRWGYRDVGLEHVSFGSVLDPVTRKPLKTREGGAPGLEELLDLAVARAEQVYRENVSERGDDATPPTPAEEREIFEAVGIGAVKYADLSQNRSSDYAFDLKKMVNTEGNTATYMQYAYARNRSIFRKGNEDPAPLRTDPPLPSLAAPEERALALQLLRFEDALAAAAADYRPHLITAYLWELSKAYSGFNQNCPVLKAETPELRRSRLLLCDLTARVLQRGLDLLGIRTVERM
jgi:arginyl-tRNA synthetase